MIDSTVSPAGMRIVKLLVGKPPRSVADLISATGVTRTAVTEQLNELVAAGYVDRGTERLPGRGRPRHVYKATDASMLMLFASNQHLVVPAIWQAIDSVGGEKLVEKVLKRVSREVANHYSSRITAKDPPKRLRELSKLLREEGALIETFEENGKLVLNKRSCPFISMLDERRSVCCVDQDMMTLVVGRTVRRTASRHEGAACCRFEVVRRG